MFTEQIAAARQQLVASGMPPDQADVLLSLLGDCVQKLTHRGPVELAKPDPDTHNAYTDENYYIDYALNIPEGSTINNWGNDVHHGDVYNVGNTITNTNVTENYEGDNTQINYGGNTTITFGPNVTLVFNNTAGNCKEVVVGLDVSTTVLEFVSDVSFDEETCELTVDKSSAMVVQDVTPVTEHLAVLGECEPEEE